MISDERLTLLRFQAANYGMTPETLKKVIRESKSRELQAGSMVIISVSELQEFLAHHPGGSHVST